jgi:hypothetical protein
VNSQRHFGREALSRRLPPESVSSAVYGRVAGGSPLGPSRLSCQSGVGAQASGSGIFGKASSDRLVPSLRRRGKSCKPSQTALGSTREPGRGVKLVGQAQSTSDLALDLPVVRTSVRRGPFQLLDFSPALIGVGQQKEILRHSSAPVVFICQFVNRGLGITDGDALRTHPLIAFGRK